MIVIATHDDIDSLTNILNDLLTCDLYGHQVLFVDTNSSNSEFINKFNYYKKEYPQFIFDRKEYTCWDSGAYLHAYLNYPSEKYIFLQDSLRINNKHIFKEITIQLDTIDVLGLFNFFLCFDSEEQKLWAENGITINNYPKYGIIGPIFSINKNILDRIPKDWFREPNVKWQACGMERRWALMLNTIGAKIDFLHFFKTYEEWRYHESTLYSTELCTKNFTKYVMNRN